MSRKHKSVGRAAILAELQARVARLEYLRLEDRHVHAYRYAKTVSDLDGPSFAGGPSTYWSWKCEHDHCPQPSGGTNHRAGIPDHFPEALR